MLLKHREDLANSTVYRSELIAKLSQAHSRIEVAFVEGGATLVAVMEIVSSLIDALSHFTGTLDRQRSSGALGGLDGVIAELAALPSLVESRQVSLSDIAGLCSSAYAHVDDMRETFRYLKVFAITVKINGAGLAEFAEFADEIRQRIDVGAQEIGSFAADLGKMRDTLTGATQLSGTIKEHFQSTVPGIAASLKEQSKLLAEQDRRMKALAEEVKTVATGVQRKIGSALSALQIGDITRQRIEHVKTAFDLCDEHLASSAGRSLSDAERDALELAIAELAAAQLDEMVADFRAQSATIFNTISSFTTDAASILQIREHLQDFQGSSDQNILARMAGQIGAAKALAGDVEERAEDSNALASSITTAVRSLITSIETIRSIKTDIHYMALNSNLRCSRLGDAGRSVNVVSGELRTFAGNLETPADEVVGAMRKVETAAEALASGVGEGLPTISQPLEDLLQAISSASKEMDSSLGTLFVEGDAVFGRITAAVRTLDFESNLGTVLDQCLADADGLLQDYQGGVALPDSVEPLAARIHAVYTMVQERDIHRRIFPGFAVAAKAAPAAVAQFESDEDLFEDALF